MARNFLIWFDEIDWEIREVHLEKYSELKGANIEAFANIRIRDKKISYLHDIQISDKDMKLVINEPIFQETCNFTHNDSSFMQNVAQKNGNKFQGTFIDALNYIKKELYDE